MRILDLTTDIPIYIIENLSPARRSHFSIAREGRKKKKYTYLWLRDGKVFVLKQDLAPVIVLQSMEDLKKL